MELMVKKHKYFLAISFVALLALLAGYISLDFYIVRSGREMITAWAANEDVSIQQGNLLSSVSKTQRILLNSDLIKAVRLDQVQPNPVSLIEIGEPFSRPNLTVLDDQNQISAQRMGFATYVLTLKIPGDRHQILSFLVRPRGLILIYSAFFTTIVFVLISFAVLLMHQAKKDHRLRENLLLNALNDFVADQQPAEILKNTMPVVVDRWNDLRQNLKKLTDEQVVLRIQAALFGIAERVAHDIRAPLGVVYSIAQKEEAIGEAEKSDLSDSALRIKQISEELLDSSRMAVKSEHDGERPSQINLSTQKSYQPDEIDLTQFIEGEISRKRKELSNQTEIEIVFIHPPSILSSPVIASKLELSRIISNLLNNSFEAVRGPSLIYVSLFRRGNDFVLEIKDTGHGVPADVLKELGSRRLSYGKTAGNGTGLYRAAEYLKHVQGSLSISSEPGEGTTVQITLPQASTVSKPA